MAKIIIVGRCGGTQTKHSTKSGKDYSITRFSEVPSMDTVDLFGDFKLPASDEVKEYVFEGGIGALNFPKLISANVVPPKK